MYDYLEAMKADIIDYIKNDAELDRDDLIYNRESLEEKLNDDLWINDSITGNASGSYTFNSYIAKEYVTDNEDLCREALQKFCTDADTIAEKFLDGEWEWFDVTIRCYLLGQAISAALDEIAEEIEAEEEEEDNIDFDVYVVHSMNHNDNGATNEIIA